MTDTLLERLLTRRPHDLDERIHMLDPDVALVGRARHLDATALALDPLFQAFAAGPLRPCRALSRLRRDTWIEVGVPESGKAPVPYSHRVGVFLRKTETGGTFDFVLPVDPVPTRIPCAATWTDVAGAGGTPTIEFLAELVTEEKKRALNYVNVAGRGAVNALRALDYGLALADEAEPAALAMETVRMPARRPPATPPAILGYCCVIDVDAKASKLFVIRRFPDYARKAAEAIVSEAVSAFRSRGGQADAPDKDAVANVLGTLKPDQKAGADDAFDICLAWLSEQVGSGTFAVRRERGRVSFDVLPVEGTSPGALPALVEWVQRLVGFDATAPLN